MAVPLIVLALVLGSQGAPQDVPQDAPQETRGPGPRIEARARAREASADTIPQARGRGAAEEAPGARGWQPVLDDNLGRLDRVPNESLWGAWVRRDQRVGFNRHAAVLADRALGDEEVTPGERACADYVLGLVGGVASRPYLARRIEETDGVERRAAVIAMGETGPGVESVLVPLLEDPDVGDCAALGLVRLRRPETNELVVELAGREGHPLADAVRKLTVFDDVPQRSEVTAAGALLLNLRWHAARLYGQIDGKIWRVVVNERLLEDREFVREAILLSAESLDHPCVPDLVLQLLLEGEGPTRLRAAVACLPRELSTIVHLADKALENGRKDDFWTPSSLDEWSVLLDEIEARRLELDALELLIVARKQPQLLYRASALLTRTRLEDAIAFGDDFSAATTADKLWACEAMGNTGAKRWLAVLEILRADTNPNVAAAARVAQVRLQSERARDDVAAILEGEDGERRTILLRAMCSAARDAHIADWLDRLMRRAEGLEAVRIATALAAQGRLDARSQLRTLLREDPPRGPQGAAIVRALARNPSREDVELLASLYPRSDDREMNAELAVALIDSGEVEVLPLVRTAIWDESGTVSMLAAGILAERASVAALVDELAQPPVQATSEDIRRLGFALGLWGGMDEVSALARSMRYNSGHPAVQGALLGALSQRTR